VCYTSYVDTTLEREAQMSEGTIYYMSDQVENLTAIPKPGGGYYTEKDLCRRVANAAASNATGRGLKTFSVAGWVARNPSQIVFIHMNSGSGKGPLFAVDCSDAPNTVWSAGLIKAMAAKMPLFPLGKVYLDTNIRFCYWFFRRLLGYAPGGLRILPRYTGKRTVVEMGCMKNREQADFVWANPALIGRAIAEYCQPNVAPPIPTDPRPLLSYPALETQPGVRITVLNGKRYYNDIVPSGPIHRVQVRLNAHYPKLAPLAVDGWYGDNTVARVKLFQKEHWYYGLPLKATGIMDARTWGKLLSV
jgi:hypothetical protein